MSHDHDDFAFEHAPGIPAPLPKGERMLWQGRPNAWRLAVESLSLKWITGYFLLLAAWRVLSAIADLGFQMALLTAIPLLLMAAISVMILYGIAWLQARATVYTITTDRVLMRIGAALQVTINLPFKQIENAALDLGKDGTGTIALEPKVGGGRMVSYLVLWPHVRPWHTRWPEPSLRAIPDAQNVADILADAAETRMAKPEIRRFDDTKTASAPAGVVAAE